MLKLPPNKGPDKQEAAEDFVEETAAETEVQEKEPETAIEETTEKDLAMATENPKLILADSAENVRALQEQLVKVHLDQTKIRKEEKEYNYKKAAFSGFFYVQLRKIPQEFLLKLFCDFLRFLGFGIIVKTFTRFYAQFSGLYHIHQKRTRRILWIFESVVHHV